MATILVIAGHGRNRDGSFDPGAKGFITKGEHKYYVENFFPAVRKYLPAGHKVELFSDYNVYDRSNLTTLAKSYGNDTKVFEMHYDATGSSAASGGHVIVHADYAPDSLDLKTHDWIKKHIGLAYPIHKGQQGISGRSDLRNCNIARSNGINYRLIELGFGTNKTDADKMVKNVDAIAKDFVQMICGKVKETTTITKPTVNNKGFSINGEAHIQSKGWVAMKNNVLGTTGQRLRLEAFNLTVSKDGKQLPISGMVHLQSLGDVEVKTNLFGTAGEKRRLEAVKLNIHSDIEYRVHMQYGGWSAWTKNNEWAGTKGKERRIEAIELKVK